MNVLPRFLRFRLGSAAILLASFFCLAHLAMPQRIAASLTLTWNDNSGNEEGFSIERQVDGGPYADYALVEPDVTSFVDGGVNDGTGYCYRVSAYNSAGSSDFTNKECAYGLIVSKSGTGMGTLTAAGINCGTDCAETYPNGETVALSATPSGGSVFAGWSGDADCSDGVVTMSAAISCTATFDVAPSPPVTLTVSVVSIANAYGSGAGVVTSSPAGIDCGADCAENYPSSTVVTLTAVPDPGSKFSGWDGGGCGSASVCEVLLDGNESISASFEPETFDLTVSVSGMGTVTGEGVDCGADCTETYGRGANVALTALPDPGWMLGAWSVGSCGSAPTCGVTLDQDTAVSATFEPTPASWNDYALSLTMRSDDNDAIGVMFRVQDADNYYRFSWDRQRQYRRLVKQENGVFTLLGQDAVPYEMGRTYDVQIVANGSDLEVWIDGVIVFSVTDSSLSQGSIALYSWGNRGSYFDDVMVEDLATGSVLLAEDFGSGDLDAWLIHDEGTSQGPSLWSAEGGVLSQDSNIHDVDWFGIAKLGTYLLYDSLDDGGEGMAMPDYEIRLTVRSEDNDAVGVMFRYQDPDNYYRFSWDRQRQYRRLVKQENGIFTLLAEDTVPYITSQSYEVRIVADGGPLAVLVDGTLIFSVADSTFSDGTVGLYSWGNRGSHFDDIVVEDLAMGTIILTEDFNDGSFDRWIIHDEGDRAAPSSWSVASGALVQKSNIHSTAGSELAKFGTFAVYR